MNKASLWTVLKILVTYLIIASSIEVPGQSFSISICRLRKEITRKCEDFPYLNRLDNLICNVKENLYMMYDLSCRPNLRNDLDIIVILKSEDILYHCILNTAQSFISSTKSLPKYELEYFNCNWLLELKHLKIPQGCMYLDNYHIPERRILDSCNISLNLYSVLYI
jgi:hypothetical protein